MRQSGSFGGTDRRYEVDVKKPQGKYGPTVLESRVHRFNFLNRRVFPYPDCRLGVSFSRFP